MNARDVMTEFAQVVCPDDALSHAAALMRDSDIGFVPVVDDRESRRLVGVLTDRDVAIRHVANGHDDSCRVGQHMTADELVTVSADTPLAEITSMMSDNQVRRVMVTDAEGKVIGVIAQADIATKGAPAQETGRMVADISTPDPLKH